MSHDDHDAPETHASGARLSEPPSNPPRNLYIDGFCAAAYVLGMRPEEIADALEERLPAWMNAIAQAPSFEGRSRLLAPVLMDLEDALHGARVR
ncbi:MAG: hypothetical protein U0165_07110 [Polyangiaceae bacterium]